MIHLELIFSYLHTDTWVLQLISTLKSSLNYLVIFKQVTDKKHKGHLNHQFF